MKGTSDEHIIFVTNMPTPYRTPVFKTLHDEFGVKFSVIFCSHRETNRSWNADFSGFPAFFLKENYIKKEDGFNFVHNNIDIFRLLFRLKPTLIVTCGFNPTHLYAFLFSKVLGIPHMVMTDGWKHSERFLSALHRQVRRVVFKLSAGVIVAGSKGAIYAKEQFKIPKEKIKVVPLVTPIQNGPTEILQYGDRDIDFLFIGQLEPRKNPLLMLDAIELISKRRHKPFSAHFVGTGVLEEKCLERAKSLGKNVHFHGSLPFERVEEITKRSRFLVFPTSLDAWGLVVNEALACGTPVIGSPYAASVYDLLNENTGFIMDDLSVFSLAKIMDQALDQSKAEWKCRSNACLEHSSLFTVQSAALALKKALDIKTV